MTKMRSSVSAIVVSIGVLCFATAPAFAQVNGSNGSGTNNSNAGGTNNSNAGGTNNSNAGGVNNSNLGGVNNSNANGGKFGAPASGSGAIQQQAADLQSRLAAADAAARASKPPAGDGVRRFLRAAGDCKCSGSAEQAELEKVKAEAAAFVEANKKPSVYQPAW